MGVQLAGSFSTNHMEVGEHIKQWAAAKQPARQPDLRIRLVRATQKNDFVENEWLRTFLRTHSHFVRALVDSQPRIYSKEALFAFDEIADAISTGSRSSAKGIC